MEMLECLVPARHVRKGADPDDSIRTSPIAKLTDNGHARGFL
jgi:hypothetical protein